MSINNINELVTKYKVKPIILKLIKQNKQIIHGGRAINVHVGFPYKRFSRDYDIFTNKNPKKAANQLDKELDIARGSNFHYVKQAVHKGTWKVKDLGLDLIKGTDDDKTIADYSRKPRRLKTIMIDGFKYSALEEIRKRKVKLLSNPNFAFRHEKDTQDLHTINLFLKAKGRKKK